MHLSTPSFDGLFEMSQSQTMQTGVCFMSLLWKRATIASSKGYARGLWLVDFDPSYLFSMSEDGCRKITTITRHARNTERSCNTKRAFWGFCPRVKAKDTGRNV